MSEEKHKPTIFDVARLAKVSTTTVSRVINKVQTVKDSNRQRVEEAIKELGFIPDASAQHLAGGKTQAIGFVMPYYEDIFHTFYAMELLRGVNQGVVENHIDLLSLHFSGGGKNHDTGILNTSYVSAILFADYSKNEELISKAKESGIPYLIINYYKEDSDDNCIGIDNFNGAVKATDYLIELGHKKIAHITGNLQVQSGADRASGYRQALMRKNIPVEEKYIVYGDWSGASGYRAMKQLLSLKEDRPTAVFVAGDEMAMWAENAILEADLKVPEDISVIGFDDIPLAGLARIPLTTMKQPLFELGRGGIGVLAKILKKEIPMPLKKLLSTELVKRKSCCPPKRL